MSEHKQRARAHTDDTKIEPEYEQQMVALAHTVDEFFNGEVKGPARKVGFVIMVFPFGEASDGRANYISNGASRKDIATLFREMAARFEGQPEMSGRA